MRKRSGQMAREGLFVVIEGLDAAGKTTLVKRLVSTYRRQGIPLTPVREPGGTRVSEQARRILLDPQATISPQSELFLYLAARAQLVADVIRPALQRRELVIADRFNLSTYAYQIGGRGLPEREVMAADRLARDGVSPDLTVLLTVSEAEARRRKRQAGMTSDRMERQSRLFYRAVRAEYLRQARKRRGILLIDSETGADDVFMQVKAQIDRRLRRRGLI